MSTSSQNPVGAPRLVLVWYLLVTALAIFTYFYGLESLHIPKNGDEYPYAHITRLTAESGHWLPLQSEYVRMRNTKPPLLFWQAIVTTDWGKNWTLCNLRYPSVIYTLLTALMSFLLARKLSGKLEAGFVAGLVYLAFFSTYRFGRPFLTSAPETFWFFLPFFVLLYWQPVMFESRLLIPPLLGVAVGIGLLYKSFALALPLAIGLSWWFFQHRRYQPFTFLARDAWKITVIIVIALGIFGLWFLLDPDPKAIWKEFVLQENVGKFDRKGGGGYLSTLLWGKGYSIWTMVTAYPVNAGLLLIPVVALFIQAFRNRGQVPDAQRLLWIWIFTLFLVFCLPTQRSARYVLPAMPALAVLLALNWDQISRKAFVASLIVAGVIVGVLAYLSFRLQVTLPDAGPYSLPYWLLLTGAGALILAAIFVPRITRAVACAGFIVVFLCFAAFMRPFDGLLGRFGPETQQAARGKKVWVPLTWQGTAEEYRLLLPGADIQGYPYQAGLTIPELGARYPFFALRLPMQETNFPAGAKIVGRRFDFGSRHTAKQIKEMIQGQVFQHLFLQELLVEAPAAGIAPPQPPGGDGGHP